MMSTNIWPASYRQSSGRILEEVTDNDLVNQSEDNVPIETRIAYTLAYNLLLQIYKVQADARCLDASFPVLHDSHRRNTSTEEDTRSRATTTLIRRPALPVSLLPTNSSLINTNLGLTQQFERQSPVFNMTNDNVNTPHAGFSQNGLSDEQFRAWTQSKGYNAGNLYAGLNHHSPGTVLLGNSDGQNKACHYYGPTQTSNGAVLCGNTSPQVAAQIVAEEERRSQAIASAGQRLGSAQEQGNQLQYQSSSTSETPAQLARRKWSGGK